MVKAEPAIYFVCEKCGYGQYGGYTLTNGWYNHRAVMEDWIDCEKCRHSNHIVQDM